MDVIDKIAPIKRIRVKCNSKPCFDGEILERIRVRDKLRKKHRISGLQIYFDNLKNAQKHAIQATKLNKGEYVKEQFKANIAKPSKHWKVLKSIGLPSNSCNKYTIWSKRKGSITFRT